MDVRAQMAGVFHLDKCLGCHTCSVVCKNLWTDRKGTEYMWWNNVETKPGTGFPRRWEDQEKYQGGWVKDGEGVRLRAGGRASTLARIFHNPVLPVLDDYYEPWTYRYGDLFEAPAGDVQPTARPVSLVTGKPMEVRAGPNWDDDLGGTQEHAAQDPGLARLAPHERAELFETGKLAFFHLPRTCNHCVNAACVASCPSGAIYKRGEDGLVVVNQDKCRGWRMCVSACPYKKVFYNWESGKSEKCVGCYPRVENGEPPACYAGCVGRIRFEGVVLYDASRIPQIAASADDELVEAQRELILDPSLPEVARAARANGIADGVIDAARRSPVLKFVKHWRLALPLHPEFRTLPMIFYVPPLLPLLAEGEDGTTRTVDGLFSTIERSRLPVRYLAGLFAAGNELEVAAAYRRLLAIRMWRRAETVGDVPAAEAERALAEAQLTKEDARAIHAMSYTSRLEDRVVLPPGHRASDLDDPSEARGAAGFARTGAR
jgi:nitrate reductase beta subunit